MVAVVDIQVHHLLSLTLTMPWRGILLVCLGYLAALQLITARVTLTVNEEYNDMVPTLPSSGGGTVSAESCMKDCNGPTWEFSTPPNTAVRFTGSLQREYCPLRTCTSLYQLSAQYPVDGVMLSVTITRLDDGDRLQVDLGCVGNRYVGRPTLNGTRVEAGRLEWSKASIDEEHGWFTYREHLVGGGIVIRQTWKGEIDCEENTLTTTIHASTTEVNPTTASGSVTSTYSTAASPASNTTANSTSSLLANPTPTSSSPASSADASSATTSSRSAATFNSSPSSSTSSSSTSTRSTSSSHTSNTTANPTSSHSANPTPTSSSLASSTDASSATTSSSPAATFNSSPSSSTSSSSISTRSSTSSPTSNTTANPTSTSSSPVSSTEASSPSTSTSPPFNAASTTSSGSDKHVETTVRNPLQTAIIASATAGGALLVIVFLIIIVLMCRGKRANNYSTKTPENPEDLSLAVTNGDFETPNPSTLITGSRKASTRMDSGYSTIEVDFTLKKNLSLNSSVYKPKEGGMPNQVADIYTEVRKPGRETAGQASPTTISGYSGQTQDLQKRSAAPNTTELYTLVNKPTRPTEIPLVDMVENDIYNT